MACLNRGFLWKEQIPSSFCNNRNSERASPLQTQDIKEVFVDVTLSGKRKDAFKMVHHGQNSIVDSIKLCAKQKNLRKGFSIHNDLLLIDLLEDRYVNSASIGMYMSCGEIMKAQEIFDELPVRHVISWNA